ncbi:MAG: ribosome maturation factor RimP [Pseudomonadota bacterium]
MIAVSEQEKRVLTLIEPQATGLDMEIVRVRLTGGKRPSLQVMAEKAGGAATDVEDCASLSRAISAVLDVDDPISDAYTLEVSTPGIDRPLTRPGDFDRWTGHAVKIELARPLDGRRRFQGVISEETAGSVKILLDDETELEATIDEMSKASLILTDELIDAAKQSGMVEDIGTDELAELELDDSSGAAQTPVSGEQR